ncbi:GNAT family N-acetyltransferase [Metabacillus idriensis]|uniref:GNAT family N-acetyltransferase n=1 Tax=Metabacillus idriensis TaxID=324768 RepID=UPI003D293662
MSDQQMQIKLIDKKDYDHAAEFLQTDLELNALIIEDLSEEHMMVYGSYLNMDLNALLMIYPEKIYYYSPVIDLPLTEFASIIQETGIRKIVGKKELIDEFKHHFQMDLETDSFMLKYGGGEDFQLSKDIKVIATLEECRKLYDLFMQVDEYKMVGPNEDFFANDHFQNIEAGKLKVFYKDEDGKMVSTAGVFMESSRTAIIVGVATPPVHRRKGYASELIRAICQKLAPEEMAIYLFYNNPEAGNLYKQLGFYEAAKWKVLGIAAQT